MGNGNTETPLSSPADAPPAPTGPTASIVRAYSDEATYELAELHQADQAELFLEGEPELDRHGRHRRTGRRGRIFNPLR